MDDGDVGPGVCPDPVTRPIMRNWWEDLTFLHWRYPVAEVQRLVPPTLEVEAFDGAAWVGLVPFHMRVARPGGRSVPWLSELHETNVRTYVRSTDGQRGVWFFSLDAARLGAVLVARAAYRLPYMWSSMRVERQGTVLRYACRRRWPGPRGARSRVEVEVGEAIAPGALTELDHFLTARWGVFSPGGRERLRRAGADHPPWVLHRAEVRHLDDELVAASGLPAPSGAPLVHAAPVTDVLLGRPEMVPPIPQP